MAEAPLLKPEMGQVDTQRRRRWVSPLLRRILLVNALPPALLAAALLYLDQYQNGLLGAEVEAMRTQARIYAGAIAEAASGLSAVRHLSHLIGGSLAQRDVLNLTLIDAATRAGDGALVQALVTERRLLKPETPLTEFLRHRAPRAALRD